MRRVVKGFAALGAMIVLAAGGEARAQSATLEAWLDREFTDIVRSCTGLQELRVPAGLSTRRVSPIPGVIARDLRGRLPAPVEVYQDQTLTTLFGTVWTYREAQGSVPAGYLRHPRLLGLDYVVEEDRHPFAGMSNIQHTHNCSSVLGFALDANANLKIGVAELTAALKSSYENTSSIAVSMVSGRFYSPVPVVLNVSAEVQPPNIDAFATYVALWNWYALNPDRVGQSNFVLERLDGIARYRFSGMTLDTDNSVSSGVSGGLVGFSASLQGNGSITAEGRTTVNDFEVVRFSGPDTMHWAPLPAVETVAAQAGGVARFVPVPGARPISAIVNAQPFRAVFQISGLPSALCSRSRWTPGEGAANVSVERRDDPQGQNGAVCIFGADITPPATPEEDGSLSVQYTMTAAFPATNPNGTGRDLVLRIPAQPFEVADGRSRLTLDPFSGALTGAPVPTASETRITGTLRYRIMERSSSGVTGVGSAPQVTIACAGADPVRIPAQAQFVAAQPSTGQPAEVRIELLDTAVPVPAGAGPTGSCEINGSVDVVIANANQPLVRTLPSRSYDGVALRPAAETAQRVSIQ